MAIKIIPLKEIAIYMLGLIINKIGELLRKINFYKKPHNILWSFLQ